jgi:hypothetical protein
MDDSSVYWTQQAHDDQRPQFKNDHHRPATASSATDESMPVVQSLRPPPVQSPSSQQSIYQTDDQLDRRRQQQLDEDQDGGKSFLSFRKTEDATVSTVAVDDDLNCFEISIDSMDEKGVSQSKNSMKCANKGNPRLSDEEELRRRAEEIPEDNKYYFHYHNDFDHVENEANDNEPDWKVKQHWWTDDKQHQQEGSSEDYHVLTCNAPNNLYTYFRW